MPYPKDYRITFPSNASPPLGHVDWVDDDGYPVRATLHENGLWSATVQALGELLNACNEPEDGVESDMRRAALIDFAREVGGRVIYTSLELAVPDVYSRKHSGQSGKHHVILH